MKWRDSCVIYVINWKEKGKRPKKKHRSLSMTTNTSSNKCVRSVTHRYVV